ncbi:hypothetical protein D3C81_1365740 [compost metagenome]
MRLEPAVLGLLEGERERVEQLVRAEPDEAALAGVDIRREGLGVARADAAVDAIARNHQVGPVLARQRLVIGHIGLEHELHAQRLAARLEDVQQPLAADADKAVAARADGAAADMDVDVVPVVERGVDLARALGVGLAQVFQRGVGEHHAPAKRVVRPVALHHHHLVGGVLQLHQQPEIQARWATAYAKHAHRSPHYIMVKYFMLKILGCRGSRGKRNLHGRGMLPSRTDFAPIYIGSQPAMAVLTCSSAVGSSIVVRSPGSRPSATAWIARRSSLPERVLGSALTK